METRRIRFEIIDEMLGTNPGVKEIHEEFIASKAPDAETRQQELEHMPKEEMVSKEMTVFYRNPETNAIEIPNHWFYGFCKSSCGYLRRVDGTKSKKLTSYKKVIDGLIKAFPDAKDPRGRFVEVHLPDGGTTGTCQRPLRAQTMQGERVALANSETVPVGSWFEIDVVCMDPKMWPTIEEWLDYGLYNGFGQWRSSGKGAFVWKYIDPLANTPA